MAVVFAVANVAVTIHRSLIPVALEGEVTQVELRREKRPGLDDVWLAHIGGRRIHVDAVVARAMAPGAMVSKPAWSTTLQVDGRGVGLRLSSEARNMLWVMPLTVAVVAATGIVARRLRRRGLAG